MRRKRKFIWLFMIVAVIWLVNGSKSPLSSQQQLRIKQDLGQVTTKLVTLVKNTFDRTTTPQNTQDQTSGATATGTTTAQADVANQQQATTASSKAESDAMTPIETIVEPGSLKPTYYYHFQAGTSDAVQQVFQTAIATYNETGLVKLVAGAGSKQNNRLTLGTYQKDQGAAAQETVELGQGGPEITTYHLGSYQLAYNQGQAQLNLAYRQSIAVSVALHELGHALGLAHSTDPASVMYPLDQGMTSLAAADLAALKQIYQ
ncbi:matrixin family metalloprotease [Lapidilactobacillus luobeiensis]|uniref:matrixin family metalloprotease n=1 Tax=Lapidilactobacillus luobeiensis TaxID=2950371 RepID=UPI0021C2F90F|nr:matrixin family metalloprotease [Lapidilactobacillus luobeiensis]